MNKIAIIGYGELGRAIHKLLEKNKDLNIEIWDKKDEQIEKTLNSIVLSAQFIFICVPSWCVREVIMDIKRSLDKNAVVVCLAKGIEEKTLKTMDSVLYEDLLENQPFSVLSGPMLAEELVAGKRGFAVCATKNLKDFKRLAGIFSGTALSISHSLDFKGLALCGVLKNIYALGLGMADGLDLGNNSKGNMAVMAIKEMKVIVKILGGREATVLSSAGLGDLIATGFSSYSRNRETGEELAKTKKCCLESEGYRSLSSIIKLLKGNTDGLLFLNALKSIIIENKNPAGIFKNFDF